MHLAALPALDPSPGSAVLPALFVNPCILRCKRRFVNSLKKKRELDCARESQLHSGEVRGLNKQNRGEI
jgi:hypothetical protein